MANYHVKITGRDREAMLDLVRKYKVAVARNTAEETPEGYRIHAHANGSQIRSLKAAGYTVEQLEDADKGGKARQKEFKEVKDKAEFSPEDLAAGRVPHYLSVADVERALSVAASPPNDAFVKLIKLPNKTWENRECSAVRVGKGIGNNRPGIYFLGGVHAREWGSPDILINFLAKLILAYRSNTGFTIGNNTFTASQIKTLVESKDIYVFPQANPDGRNYSMTKDAMWRKNRRPAPPKSKCLGVDINRNYDFLWNFPVYFASTAAVQNSKDPCDETYIGPTALSEPEAKNAVWILETHPYIRYFIDLHSFSEVILYNWGDDDNQSANPNMNFQNPAFNGKRGISGDAAYKEYIPTNDSASSIHLTNILHHAINRVRGRSYGMKQSFDLYPTAGTSTDYAFGLHMVNPHKAKIYSYTIEWGSPNNPTPFHPPYAEMQKIIQEITAALLAFCIAAT
jgi:carboxypeptidase T